MKIKNDTKAQLPHIVQVSAYYPPHIGGVELRVKELSERLAANGYKIDVLTSNIGSKQKEIERDNLRVTYLPSIEFAHTPIMPTLIWQIIRLNKKKTILHLHIAQAFFPETVALIAKLRKIPYVAHFRMDTERSGKMGFLLPIHKKWILGPVLRNAKTVIVNAPDYVKLAEIKYKVKEDRIIVIPNGTNFDVVKQPKSGISNKSRILFVGRFADQKNPLLLLQAMSIIAKTSTNIDLVMVGDGELRREVEVYIKDNNLSTRVKLLGFLTGKKLEKQYELADIFVLSSRAESFATVLIEAMAKGLPIIATNIPAVRNTIKDRQNGLLVSQDPVSVADAIQKLIKDKKLYEKISGNNRLRVKDYQWDGIVDRIELVYEK
jgi:glycosyltransferase involved in cell wall biosynthesis